MRWTKNLALVTVSILIAVFASELILRSMGRYTDVANIEIGGSNKIWDRPPNHTYYERHPDVVPFGERTVQVSHNAFGARVSSESDNRLGSFNIGVFGDSFTENRGMKNEFTFVSVINENSDNSDIRLHNFGVASYGLEQSFQHWLDKRALLDMDVVLYVFCANDLRDTYAAEIFDKNLMARGELKNIVSTEIDWPIRLIAKFHLAYLLVETYNKLKYIMSPGRYNFTVKQYISRVNEKYTVGWTQYGDRVQDQYADEIMIDFLGTSPSKQTLDLANHFQNTLELWKKMVEERGDKFYVVILPRDVEAALFSKLIPANIDIVQLLTNKGIEQLSAYPWTFKENLHWGEYGNLAGGISLNLALREDYAIPFLEEIDDDFVADKIKQIELFYKVL